MMQKSVNFRVKPQFVNLRVFCFLLVACIALHVLAQVALPDHPILSSLLSVCESLGWLFVLVMGAVFVAKGIKRLVCAICANVVTWTRTHVHFQRGKKEAFVSVKQLKQVRKSVQWLGLALHGTTAEEESARIKAFALRNQEAPDLVLPSQNAALHAEFDGLVRFLNHVGFPEVENVQLKTSEFELVNTWIIDLGSRLFAKSQEYRSQQQALRTDLSRVIYLHESLGQVCPAALKENGYYRIQGALKMFKKMADDDHLPSDFGRYIVALNSDLNTLYMQLNQPIA